MSWQGQFKESVTSTAFHLSLSKNMVRALLLAYYYSKGLSKPLEFYDFGASVQSMRCLIHRGLIEHHDDKPKDATNHSWYTLTPAGEHVFELCVLAGLIKVEE